MSAGSRDLASRWSERRRKVAESEAPVPEPDAPDEAVLQANVEAAEAIDLEAIDAGTDMSVFMREGVPDLLRKKALRALWRSDPVFANVDRLNDYDENFADPARTVAVLQSAWQAGRGYLFPEDEPEGLTETAGSEPASAAGEGRPGVEPGLTPQDSGPDLAAPSDARELRVEDPPGLALAEADAPERPAHLSLRARLGV